MGRWASPDRPCTLFGQRFAQFGAAARRLVVFVCLLVVYASPLRAVELFGPPLRYSVCNTPNSLAVGDFNRDGIPDVAVPCYDDVSILLGNVGGGFDPAPDVPLVGRNQGIAVGDFNGDDNPDLVVGNEWANAIAILLGDGQGSFFGGRMLVGRKPKGVGVADFNGDDRPDLAIALHDDDAAQLLRGDGYGVFHPFGEAIEVGHHPLGMALGDVNGDGDQDVVVANLHGDSLNVLLGDGAGGIEANTQIDGIALPRSVAIADLDGDGHVDLAVASAAAHALVVLAGDGSGNFELPPRELPYRGLPVGGAPVWVEVADVDVDGRLDLVSANQGDGTSRATLSVLRNLGNGEFAKGPDVALVASPAAAVVREFDRDGIPDVVVVSPSLNAVGFMPGNGLGGFVSATELPLAVGQTGWGVECAVIEDVDGDDQADVVVASWWNDAVHVLRGDGAGGLLPPATFDAPFAACVAVADFTGIGCVDLAIPHYRFDEAGRVSILRGDGSGGFSPHGSVEVGDLPVRLAVADLDLDGTQDLVVGYVYYSRVTVLLGRGDGSFEKMAGPGFSTCEIEPCGCEYPFIVDLDGRDGPDLAVANYGAKSVGLLRGDGQGGFDFIQEVPLGLKPEWVFMRDFTGDGVLDLLFGSRTDSGLGIALGDVDGGFVRGPTLDLGAIGYPALGDFNGDGVPDLACGVLDGHRAAALLADGKGDFVPTPGAATGAYPSVTAAGDLDGDGRLDLVTVNIDPDRGSITVLLNRLAERADVNGSNRIDGFDLYTVATLAGRSIDDPDYLRRADVDLNGTIEGDDQALIAERFGELRNQISPFEAVLEPSPPAPAPDTVTFQPADAGVATRKDRLHVTVMVHDDDPTTGARFAVEYAPADAEHERVLEYLDYEEGSYLTGGLTTYDVESTPGRVEVLVFRFPAEDRPGSGEPQPLLDLVFGAVGEGEVTLRFAPAQGHERPHLFDAGGDAVAGVTFTGEAGVVVTTTAESTGGERIGVAPDELDFGVVEVGHTGRETLRISNLGFSGLEVLDAQPYPPLPEFLSFFTSPVVIPPFGRVDLIVEFSPQSAGTFSTDLVIHNSDREIQVPLHGESMPQAATRHR